MQEGFYERRAKKSLDALTRHPLQRQASVGTDQTPCSTSQKSKSGQFSLNLGEYAIESVVETVRAATESLAETKKLVLTPMWPNACQSVWVTSSASPRCSSTSSATPSSHRHGRGAHHRVGHERLLHCCRDRHRPRNTSGGVEARVRAVPPDRQLQYKAKGGTGLGLAIAKQIVGCTAAHLGRVDAGQGAPSRWNSRFARNNAGAE